jgi:hypothetical protein
MDRAYRSGGNLRLAQKETAQTNGRYRGKKGIGIITSGHLASF